MKEIADLQPGMMLEGVVTNVTKFGAFVDVGVHQDGLVHVSELANRFVKDPNEVVKVGQIVKVQVLSVDPKASVSHYRSRPYRPLPNQSEGEGHETGEQARGAAAQEPGRPDRGAGHAFPHPLKGVRPAEKRSLSI